MSIDAVSDARGRVKVLAIDHRDSLKTFLRPDDPGSVRPDDLTQLKIDVVSAIAPLATGVMLEPEYSIPQVIDAGAVPDGVGVIAALEAQGYMADPINTVTEILPGWSVEQAVAAGAAMCKLLLPYHPDRATAGAQEAVVDEVVRQCHGAGVPVVVEPVAFALDDPATHTDVVVRSIERLRPSGADLLKVPFPGRRDDPAGWGGACEAVADAAAGPWVILSGGGAFEDFAAQLEVAMANGCHGFMVGRALWGEAARAQPAERARLLVELVEPRFMQLCEVVDRAAAS